jgi:hypothetical protein
MEHAHFVLDRWKGPLARRRRPAPSKVTRDNRGQHGKVLSDQVVDLANRLMIRKEYAQFVNPKLIFKLILKAGTSIEEEQIHRMGLGLLGYEERSILVVFPDNGTLDELIRYVGEYAGIIPQGHKYDHIAAIESIEEISSLDRTGVELRRRPIGGDEVTFLDVEIWHGGNREDCESSIEGIRRLLGKSGLRLTDQYIGVSLCVVRLECNLECFGVLVGGDEFDFIKEVERRPTPTYDHVSLRGARIDGLDGLLVSGGISDDLAGVLIVDGGVAAQHPLLSEVLGDAQDYLDDVSYKGFDGRELGREHGTAVAGLAVYGDIIERLNGGGFRPDALLFSARVSDGNNEFDPEILIEKQIERALDYFLGNYPQIRVVNFSLGNSNSVYTGSEYQFRLAATLDELAYK